MPARLRLAALAVLILLCPAAARDFGQWANQPPEVREWYRNVEIMPAARERFPFVKCCDGADVVLTKFRVDKSSGADTWFWLDGETWKRVPDDIVHWGESAPGGQPHAVRLWRERDVLLSRRWRDLIRMCAWLLYGLGLGAACAAGWWLRGLRDEHEREQKPSVRVKPKDFPYP